MSYEGYERVLCKLGHLHHFDCYDTPDYSIWKCHCVEKAAWTQDIDTTNGSYCSAFNETNECLAEACCWCDEESKAECKKNGGRIDGWFELEVNEEAEFEVCKCCGHSKKIKERTYKIPKDKGRML